MYCSETACVSQPLVTNYWLCPAICYNTHVLRLAVQPAICEMLTSGLCGKGGYAPQVHKKAKVHIIIRYS